MGSEAPESLALGWVSPWVLRAVVCTAEYRILLPLPRVGPRTTASFQERIFFCFQLSLPDFSDYAGYFSGISEKAYAFLHLEHTPYPNAGCDTALTPNLLF